LPKKVAEITVNPRYLAIECVGVKSNKDNITYHHSEAASLISTFENGGVLDYSIAKRIYEHLLISYPMVIPLTNLLKKIRYSSSFEPKKEIVKAYDEIKYRSTKDVYYRALKAEIVEKLRAQLQNSPEFMELDREVLQRRGELKNLESITTKEAYRNLKSW